MHIALNDAGIGGPISLVGDYPVDGWDKAISINIPGIFYGHALSNLIKHLLLPALIIMLMADTWPNKICRQKSTLLNAVII